MKANDKLKVVVLGASGYTGAELLRLVATHGGIEVVAVTAARRAGSPLGDVHPHLDGLMLPDLVAVDDVDFSAVDAVFSCLPHGTAQATIASLPAHLKVVDLSADYRFSDPGVYAEWYGREHMAPDLQRDAVYGLTEIRRDEVAAARLVANPGCYTTTSELALVPCLEEGLIDTSGIVIDAKSGVSGAGREARESSLHTEVSEGLRAYGIARHRHAPEIEQELTRAAGETVTCTFTPHLVPMNRGILATIYVSLQPGAAPEDLRDCPGPALPGRILRSPDQGGKGAVDSGREGFEPVPHRGLRRSRSRTGHPHLGPRQSGQGRIGTGTPEHERHDRPGRDPGPTANRRLPLTSRGKKPGTHAI